MRSSYTYLYTHFIWSTWKRLDLIDPEYEHILYQLITEKITEHKCQLISIGGTEDHIHVLVNINPVISVSKLIKEVKGYSSYAMGNLVNPGSPFKWQGGYGALSVSPGAVSRISKYIKDQKMHHQDETIILKWEL